MDHEPHVLQLIAFGRATVQAGLLASTCGNASVRIDEQHIAISASGAELGALGPEHVAIVSLAQGERLLGPTPSMETDLHRRAYLLRPRTGAVLHCQSRAATLLACMVDPPRNLDFVPEVPAYVRLHAYAPYAPPGSPALAEAVEQALGDPAVTVVQMVNHGQVVIGGTWQKVVRRATFFELACWMASQGRALRTIPEDDARALRKMTKDV